jgi:glutamyl-tRNA synthetase
LHIGGARTVLFNWLLARRSGGTFVLRIEDTDQARHVEDSVQKILEDLRWLGLNWDEGPEVGGPYGPYFQSWRRDIYDRYLQQLIESGDAYYSLESPEELQAMREAAKREKRAFKYLRPDPLPTIEQGLSARAALRPVVIRFKMPDTDITVHDDILGDVTLKADQLEDCVIQKGDGFPTYHFACVVDDELMKITHVLRGQEHLINTPKHVALQRALGFSTPRYAHMPVIFNMDGSKMSKRDKERALQKGEPPPEIDVHDFRLAGYLPEAVVNFIALLGWSAGDDREHFTVDELISLFSVERVGRTNARFDREKLVAFNTVWAAGLQPARLPAAFKDYLSVNNSPLGRADDALLSRLLKVCEGFRTFRDVESKTRFLFTPDDAVVYEPKAVKQVLEKGDGAGYAMLEHLLPRFEGIVDWTAGALEESLRGVCQERDTKLGNVAQPVRVAVTGTTISPPIYDSLELLGKDPTISRMRICLTKRG